MQLTINASIIPLDPGINLPLVLRSPLFLTSDNKIPGSYIFNFSIPAGDEIRTEFGQAHRIQRHGRATAELPYILTDGLLKYSGKCIVTQATVDSYEIACKIGNGDFTANISNKTLKDLDLGGDRDIADIYSVANTDPHIYFQESESANFNVTVSGPDQIISDFTGLLTDDGATFTADKAMTVKMQLNMHSELSFGSVSISIKKNGAAYISHLVNDRDLEHKYDHTITLAMGDIITVSLQGHSESAPHGYQFDFELYSFVLEYMSENVFNAAATLDQDTCDFALFPVHNNQFLVNFPEDAFRIDNLSIKTIYTKYFPVLNYWLDGEFPLFLSGSAEGESFICANLFTPFVYLNTLLSKIASEAGYTVVNSPFTGEFKNLVLFNAYAENTYNSSSTTLIPLKNTYNLSDHVPAVKQNDFLRYISILTGFMPVVDNDLLTITFVDLRNKHLVSGTNPAIPFPGTLLSEPKVTVDPEYKGIKLELKKAGPDKYLERIKDINSKLVYKGSVTHISDLPTSGNLVNDMYLVTALNEYYVFQYNPELYNLSWWFFSKKFPVVYTEGTESFLTVTSELCPMLTTRMLDESLSAPANRFWIIPQTEQAGILEGFPDSLSAEYGLQVLYYKGMSDDSLSDAYPLGSCRFADYTGSLTSFPDLSSDALFDWNKYFLKWLAYETKPVTFKAILTRAQLRQLKFDQVYSGTGFNFLLKELRINLTVDGISMAEMDVYTC
jgi:hypothetical protein